MSTSALLLKVNIHCMQYSSNIIRKGEDGGGYELKMNTLITIDVGTGADECCGQVQGGGLDC